MMASTQNMFRGKLREEINKKLRIVNETLRIVNGLLL